ncbi:MAG: hypothetical protein JNK65_09220, partial [Deltaproteobacteria bacterium]|nr:hypothetical protein [Deltaproteobacteria bacterium]
MKQNFKHHYSFLSPFLILFLLITLTGCGDFADIFQKGNRTAKAPSKKSKEKVVGQKNRSVKGKVVTGRFIWPLQSEVSSGFGERDGKPHDGIDIRSPKGTP